MEIGVFIGILSAGYLFVAILYALIGMRRAVLLGKKAERAENILPGASRRILIIGDSISYGTGASRAEYSLAGRLINNFPESSVDNQSENAMSASRLAHKLEALQGTYDLITIYIGGVDALSFSPRVILAKHLREALARAKALAPRVVLISVNNSGLAPAFLFPLSRLFSYRSRLVSELCGALCRDMDVTHVPLWEGAAEDSLRRNAAYAEDGMHPSDEGYALWYEKIKPRLSL